MAATASTPRRPLETPHTALGGSNGNQDSEPLVGLPFHGSCSRCHHFHINHQFTFSLDSTIHTRLLCERCQHPLFGLGRASTQNTLASVESGSTFTPRICIDREDQQRPPALQFEMAPGSPRPGLLTTIAERRSPSPSRSTSKTRTPTSTRSTVSVTGAGEDDSIGQHEPIGTRAGPKGTAQGNSKERALHPHIVTLKRLRTVGRRFKRRFSAKPREWNFPRIGLQIIYAHRAGTISHSSTSASKTEVSSGQDPQDNVGQTIDRTEEDTEDRHAPLRARRRELTLAKEKEVALSSKCECSAECSCVSGSHVAQVGRPGTPENIHVPGFMFDHPGSSTPSTNSQPSHSSAQDLALSHIGGHFDSSRRSSSADESSSAAESGPRRIMFSQCSTLCSDGSSVSLRPRRPPVGRASSMPAGPRTQFFAGFRTGSQNSSMSPGSGWSGLVRNPVSLNEGSMPGHTSLSESSQNRDSSSRGSTTSVSNLRNPEEDDRLVNGISPADQSPTVDGDEVTPTPHSGIPINGDSDGGLPAGSDALSSALQDLANHDMVDHGTHSPGALSDQHTQ